MKQQHIFFSAIIGVGILHLQSNASFAHNILVQSESIDAIDSDPDLDFSIISPTQIVSQSASIPDLTGLTDMIFSFSKSPRHIATIHTDKTVKIWTSSWDLITTLPRYESKLIKFNLNSDEQLIITINQNRTAQVWGTDGNLLTILEDKTPFSNALFSPDSNHIISTSDENWPYNEVHIWNLDGNHLETLDLQDLENIENLRFPTATDPLISLARQTDKLLNYITLVENDELPKAEDFINKGDGFYKEGKISVGFRWSYYSNAITAWKKALEQSQYRTKT